MLAKLGSIGRWMGLARLCFHDYAFGMLHGEIGMMVDGKQELQDEDFEGFVE